MNQSLVIPSVQSTESCSMACSVHIYAVTLIVPQPQHNNFLIWFGHINAKRGSTPRRQEALNNAIIISLMYAWIQTHTSNIAKCLSDCLKVDCSFKNFIDLCRRNVSFTTEKWKRVGCFCVMSISFDLHLEVTCIADSRLRSRMLVNTAHLLRSILDLVQSSHLIRMFAVY